MIREIGTEFRFHDQLTNNLSKSFFCQHVIEKNGKPARGTAMRGFAIGMHKWRIGMKKLITKSAE
ncbi:hypothetical protein C8R21_1149 [Nitrosospira multiformis]|uniref:Uncharacterized protein n=1 Tax=Nitrosospira multiformis TaxID=1231 RepID=A0A2T5IA34_9PROT|nr:hypothetical protein [Nitrosospira multiformis]PTQ80664.1 hypothetical protein C8R21_1149 [Nitrosospira multiformis]